MIRNTCFSTGPPLLQIPIFKSFFKERKGKKLQTVKGLFPYFPHSSSVLHINQKMDLSDSSWVTDTEIRMIYLFSVITVPLGFQNDIIYTGTGLQAGGGLDGFAIWRHAVRSLGSSRGSLSRFKLLSSNSSECSENQHLPQHETKGKYGKMGNRGGHRDDPSTKQHFPICQHMKKTR